VCLIAFESAAHAVRVKRARLPQARR
jgi:hypothetical protein